MEKEEEEEEGAKVIRGAARRGKKRAARRIRSLGEKGGKAPLFLWDPSLIQRQSARHVEETS